MLTTVNDILIKMTNIDVLNHNEYIKSVESFAMEMINSEFALLWRYDNTSNTISTINNNIKHKDIIVGSSIMKDILDSKKPLYHNHIINHKSYASQIDNPLSLSLKSMIILPILDKGNVNCIGFITAFNSTEYNHMFKRYDIKILEALLPYGRICLNKSLFIPTQITLEEKPEEKDFLLKEELLKKELLEKELEIQELKNQIENMELFQEFDMVSQEEVDSSVMELLKPKIEETVPKKPKYPIEVFKSNESKLHKKIRRDIDFMLNELSYISKAEHDIYHFLELIKNSLHDKGQLQHIEKVLKDKDFLYRVTNDYYQSRSVRVVYEEVHVMNFFEDIVNLYSINMSNSNLTFNVFINPYMPKYLLLDKDLTQSILIPLINNIYAFTSEYGAIELLIDYNYSLEVLRCKVYGLAEKKLAIKISEIFKKEEIDNTLGINKVGLGLSVSSNLIKLLKGTLEIKESKYNGESFSFSIPAENFAVNELEESAINLESLNIGILMDKSNQYAYKNFLRHMEIFGISESKLFISSDYRECESVSLTHLFCFDNMLHKDMNLKNTLSFTILKYDLYKNYKEYLETDSINELYLNFHYGRKLKKLLFPDLIHEDISDKSLIIEEKLSSRFKNKFLNKLLK